MQQRQTIPIDVVVNEPEKFGDGMNSYITYRIKTSVCTNNTKHFAFLSLVIKINHPTGIIPKIQRGISGSSEIQRLFVVP